MDTSLHLAARRDLFAPIAWPPRGFTGTKHQRAIASAIDIQSGTLNQDRKTDPESRQTENPSVLEKDGTVSALD